MDERMDEFLSYNQVKQIIIHFYCPPYYKNTILYDRFKTAQDDIRKQVFTKFIKHRHIKFVIH